MAKKKRSDFESIGAKFGASMGRLKGKIGEAVVFTQESMKGKPLTETGVGHDGRRGNTYFEVKAGQSQQTKRQKKEQKKIVKKGGKYVIARVKDIKDY